MGLEVIANALKAAINTNLSANTGALRWQGAMSHHLEVGVGLEKKTYRWRAGPASGAIRCWFDSSWAEKYHDAFGVIRFLS